MELNCLESIQMYFPNTWTKRFYTGIETKDFHVDVLVVKGLFNNVIKLETRIAGVVSTFNDASAKDFSNAFEVLEIIKKNTKRGQTDYEISQSDLLIKQVSACQNKLNKLLENISFLTDENWSCI